MNQIKQLVHSAALKKAQGLFLAGLAALAVVALCSSGLLTRAQAAGGPGGDEGNGEPLAQEAELLQVLTGFHAALSYGGDITAMMSLWADDCSLTFNNGTPFVGKAGVQSFFLASGYFHNTWVSLAPEFKTTLAIHGNKAEASTQCIATDVSAPPNYTVKSVIQVYATLEKVNGKWLYTSMNNTSGAPL